MRIRRVLLATTMLALAASSSATLGSSSWAASKVCNLVTDGEGDGGLRATTYGPVEVNSPPMDIIGADFATGAKTVVATIKVASLELDPQALPEVTYSFFFKVKNTTYSFTLVRDRDGNAEYSFSNGSVTGAINATTKTISFSTARSNVKELKVKNQKFSEMRATTKTRFSNADTAGGEATKTYLDKTKSCLAPK